ncbi:MAG: phosphatidylserine decarboxylase [Myxococcales bacterium]|nr:phosphatidylserine decarboxylase [Myxococcales bacterium]
MQSATERTAARLLQMLPRERITRALGKLTEANVPRPILDPVLHAYAKAYSVDLGEAVVPSGGFRTFNEFFTRELRDGARPIDGAERTLVSPADGRFDDAGAIDDRTRFFIKGREYTAASLLGSAEDAQHFADGQFAIVYLSPRDYHRVHAPDRIEVELVRHVPGVLFPVNDFGVRTVPGLFAKNERVVVLGRSPDFGRVAVVLVGAMIVGKIDLYVPSPARPPIGGPVAERAFDVARPVIERGEQLGSFSLGSTVVMLVERAPEGALFDEWSKDKFGALVRMGEPILRRRST